MQDLAKEAAKVLGFTVVIKTDGKTGTIRILKDSKVIDEIPYNAVTDEILLADTGNNTNVALVVSSLAVVALVAGIAVKKFANA